MEQLERKISVRRLTKTDDKDYEDTIRIYNEETPVSIKMDSKAIAFWLNRNNEFFESLIFSLCLDEEIAGFAMMTYIKRTKIATVDYIILHKRYADDNTIFFPYLSLLQNFLSENKYEWDYIVNEISNEKESENFGGENYFFKKISYLGGYGKIEAKYYTPPIDINGHKKSFKASLYIKSNFKMKTISKSTYLRIVSSIYNDYYRIWYMYFLSPGEFEYYKQSLEKSFKSIERNIRFFRILSRTFKVNYSPIAFFTLRYKIKKIILLFALVFPISTLYILLYQHILKLDFLSKISPDIINSILGSLIIAVATIFITKETTQ